MNILMVVCARGGSKGVKNKNIRLLCGKPLIAYSLEHCKAWGRAAHIIVSTDSSEIAEIALRWGAEVPFMRPPELATDTAPKVPVIRHALLSAEAYYGSQFDVVVDIDASAPLRTVRDIEGAFQAFCFGEVDTVFSVVPAHRNPYFNMVEEGLDGYCQLVKPLPGVITSRQIAPKVFDLNASIYFYKSDYLRDLAVLSPISRKSKVYVMDPICARDIDSEEDFNYVEYLVQRGLVTL
ncbi:MAG: acylneuraminate cytidylyltransferase family protein [Candidatus Omnitrophica bacterium]|nr:acylneuraminate cytidylyltransferase family protein [Candidatus Omnitrophota bacterium]